MPPMQEAAPPPEPSNGEPEQAALLPSGVDVPPPAEVDGLEPWIVDLPGDDGTILDEANALVSEKGGNREVTELSDLNGMPEGHRAALRERLEKVAK